MPTDSQMIELLAAVKGEGPIAIAARWAAAEIKRLRTELNQLVGVLSCDEGGQGGSDITAREKKKFTEYLDRLRALRLEGYIRSADPAPIGCCTVTVDEMVSILAATEASDAND